jgi:hypothetical protein
MKVNMTHFFKSFLYLTRFVKWDIVQKNESLYIKIGNDLGLNKF